MNFTLVYTYIYKYMYMCYINIYRAMFGGDFKITNSISAMGTEVIDEAFIQAPEHRPKLTIIEAEGIPLIDLSRSQDELVREIGSACKEWGFFQVINHRVPVEALERIEAAAREFFALPLEEKMKVRRDEKNVLGYFDTEHTKSVRDWKEVFDFCVEDPVFVPVNPDFGDHDEEVRTWSNQWPENPAGLRETCEEYAKEMQKLTHKLMELIALSLGLPENRFSGFFKDQTSYVRLKHYPPCPIPHLALGVGRHTDSCILTVLAQDEVGGLEVKRKTDGEWIRVKPTPNAYIINVGATIEVWSNERYESVEHRVTVNSNRGRFSIPFFFMPAHYTMVKPLEELINEQNPAKYRAYNWGKFWTSRKASNFSKDVENIQIQHFRVSE